MNAPDLMAPLTAHELLTFSALLDRAEVAQVEVSRNAALPRLVRFCAISDLERRSDLLYREMRGPHPWTARAEASTLADLLGGVL